MHRYKVTAVHPNSRNKSVAEQVGLIPPAVVKGTPGNRGDLGRKILEGTIIGFLILVG